MFLSCQSHNHNSKCRCFIFEKHFGKIFLEYFCSRNVNWYSLHGYITCSEESELCIPVYTKVFLHQENLFSVICNLLNFQIESRWIAVEVQIIFHYFKLYGRSLEVVHLCFDWVRIWICPPVNGIFDILIRRVFLYTAHMHCYVVIAGWGEHRVGMLMLLLSFSVTNLWKTFQFHQSYHLFCHLCMKQKISSLLLQSRARRVELTKTVKRNVKPRL